MPTVCKISLDAEEYKRQLREVVEESRKASSEITGMDVTKVGLAANVNNAVKQSGATAPSGGVASYDPSNNLEDKNITVTAEVVGEEKVREFSKMVSAIPANKKISVVATHAANTKSSTAVPAASMPAVGGVPSDAEVTPDDVKSVGEAMKDVQKIGFAERMKKGLSGAWKEFSSGQKPLQQLKEGIFSLINPWGLVAAAAGMLMTAGKACWDTLTESTEEYAAKAAASSEHTGLKLLTFTVSTA